MYRSSLNRGRHLRNDFQEHSEDKITNRKPVDQKKFIFIEITNSTQRDCRRQNISKPTNKTGAEHFSIFNSVIGSTLPGVPRAFGIDRNSSPPQPRICLWIRHETRYRFSIFITYWRNAMKTFSCHCTANNITFE